MRLHGRIVACGSVSRYNATEALPGPAEPVHGGHEAPADAGLHRHPTTTTASPRSSTRSAPRVADGTIRYRETVVDGIERRPEAFIGHARAARTSGRCSFASAPAREAAHVPRLRPQGARGQALLPHPASRTLLALRQARARQPLNHPSASRAARSEATYSPAPPGPPRRPARRASRRRRRRRAERPRRPARASRCRSPA